jgi:hypothetical protein
MTEVELLRTQIAFARGYTVRLVDSIAQDDWFRQPPGGVTHVAWQVGHLTMAEYYLALERIRGRQPGDDALVAKEFLALFARESVPDADPAKYPPAAEIRAAFDRVHQQTLRELEHLSADVLPQPVVKPHPLAKTKGEMLRLCSHHEMLHAGQIGLLRRLFGEKPLW